ncbi:Gfo/Idh/MocA family oxidoreductase [Chryseolinea sp. H1M3-3]|uniref:Gfo/Idh/MocA family protein n=1 Tax=Chryseolinea sp. H1M3-3 TaxID=3034144 RepID=UPI0023ED528A|nr:Gfo/Idh/MocA family oxidoreductase [Chryseolinea sp. H1M3-3]
MKVPKRYTRRIFISDVASKIGLGVLFSPAISSCHNKKTADKNDLQIMETKKNKRLGIALVGLGKYSTEQLAPALSQTKYCYLAGVVTGTIEKADRWQKKYDIPTTNIYNYINFDDIKNNPDIDIVYVVLPNALHREYVIRAAEAGKHVICEKPMALTVDECDEMIAACKKADRLLSIGYRLHFEPHNQEMMRLGQQKIFGGISKMVAENGLSEVEGWRLDKQLAGGGPLMDVGIYCVQGARYTTGMEPIAVRAQQEVKKDDRKFREIEESLTWQMEFPDGLIAECKTSYSEEFNLLRAEANKGWFELSPAYEYTGIKGRTSSGKMDFPQVNQQARQMDDFALAILNNRPTPVPGEMGRQDVKILQAIYQAMETGNRIPLTEE